MRKTRGTWLMVALAAAATVIVTPEGARAAGPVLRRVDSSVTVTPNASGVATVPYCPTADPCSLYAAPNRVLVTGSSPISGSVILSGLVAHSPSTTGFTVRAMNASGAAVTTPIRIWYSASVIGYGGAEEAATKSVTTNATGFATVPLTQAARGVPVAVVATGAAPTTGASSPAKVIVSARTATGFTVRAVSPAGTALANTAIAVSYLASWSARVDDPGYQSRDGIAAVTTDASGFATVQLPAALSGAPDGIQVSAVAPSSGGTIAASALVDTATAGGFRVRVLNPVGAAVAGAAVQLAYHVVRGAREPGAAPTAPGQPAAVTATAGDARATVSWAPPASDGGSPITGYTVTASPGGATVTAAGTAGTAAVTGLTNGTAYTFTVTARTAYGTGTASAASAPVTPRPVGPPAAPGGVRAVPRDGGALVSWDAPADTGGSPITSYRVTASPGGASLEVTGATTASAANLTNGTAYTFVVTASNVAGEGPPSAASAPVTPVAARTPGAPSPVAVVARDRALRVTWTRPADDGGAPIDSYGVTVQPGNLRLTADATAREATVDGLTNGTAYTVAVTAVNKVGAGSAATAPGPVTAAPTAPDAPTRVAAGSGGPSTVRVSWAPPQYTGGSAITGYTVTATPGPVTVTVGSAATSAQVTGLVDGTDYTVTVAARNAVGASAPSTAPTAVPAGGTASAATVVLSPAAMATLTTYAADGTLTFTGAPAEVTGLTADRIVVAQPAANAPQGLLRKVASISTTGGTTTVSTVPASLEEAVEQGDFATTRGVADAGTAPVFRAARPGVQLRDVTGPTLNFSLDTVTVGEGIKLSGSAKLTPTLVFNAGLGMFFRHPHAEVGLRFDAEMNTGLSVTKSVEVKDLPPVLLGNILLGTQVVFVGPVPLLITEDIDVLWGSKISVSGGVTFNQKYRSTITAGIKYADGNWDAYKDASFSSEPGGGAGPTISASYEDGITAKMNVKLERIVGPFVQGSLLGTAKVDPFADPWASLGAKASLGAGGKLEFLGRTLAEVSFNVDIASVTFWHTDGPFVGITLPSTAKATTQNGTRIFSSGGFHHRKGLRLQFDAPGLAPVQLESGLGPDNILIEVPPPTGVTSGAKFTLRAFAPPTGLYPAMSATVEITFGVGPAAPTNVRVVQVADPFPTDGLHNFQVSFGASPSAGDSPIILYVWRVVINGEGVVCNTNWANGSPGTFFMNDLHCPGALHSGQTYPFQVFASNEYGQGQRVTVNVPLTQD